jgi:hypothetical protein
VLVVATILLGLVHLDLIPKILDNVGSMDCFLVAAVRYQKGETVAHHPDEMQQLQVMQNLTHKVEATRDDELLADAAAESTIALHLASSFFECEEYRKMQQLATFDTAAVLQSSLQSVIPVTGFRGEMPLSRGLKSLALAADTSPPADLRDLIAVGTAVAVEAMIECHSESFVVAAQGYFENSYLHFVCMDSR